MSRVAQAERCGRRPAGILAVCAALAAATLAARDARCAEVSPLTFLVATRNLIDPMFQQSVILMLPTQQRPLVAGLIINKPTEVPLRKFFTRVPALTKQAGVAYFGGPVNIGDVCLVLRAPKSAASATRLFDDVFMSADAGAIAGFLANPSLAKDVRVVFGRAQWTEDQLQAEILEGSWYIVPARAEMVFSTDPAHVWRKMVDRAQLQEVDATPDETPSAFALLFRPIDSRSAGAGF